MAKDITIAFMGNPNCGKTTLFNAYTGANLKVANWPGVTVERVEGAIRDHDMNLRLVDLPGTYSLTSYTMEEQVSRQFVMGDEVDMIINVVDASSLERSLYLTLQLLEIGKPVVVALNMMDIGRARYPCLRPQSYRPANPHAHCGSPRPKREAGQAHPQSWRPRVRGQARPVRHGLQ